MHKRHKQSLDWQLLWIATCYRLDALMLPGILQSVVGAYLKHFNLI